MFVVLPRAAQSVKLAMDIPRKSRAPQKKVLVHLGKRREVTFFVCSGSEGDVVPLLDAVGKVFSDVLPLDNLTYNLSSRPRTRTETESLWTPMERYLTRVS